MRAQCRIRLRLLEFTRVYALLEFPTHLYGLPRLTLHNYAADLTIFFASLRHGHAAAMDTRLRPAGVPYTRLGPAGVPSACLRPAGVPHSCLRPGAGCRASAHGATHAFIC